MDEADQTADRMEKEEALRRRFVPKEEIPACGVCYWCEAGVPTNHKFCDAECRDQWEQYQKVRRITNA